MNRNYIENMLIKSFVKKLYNKFDIICKNVCKNRRIMIISNMAWRYDYFNIAFLKNALSLIVYSLYKGCIPVITINSEGNEYCKWEWYFEQPYFSICKRGG